MTRLRVALVVLLLWAAYWAALPWIDCARGLYRFGGGVQICTFGPPSFLSGMPGGMPAWGFWPNLLLGVVYLAVAVLVAARRWPM